MVLSEHERRMLAEIEQALFDSDPKFARSVKATPRARQRRPLLAGVLFAVGIVALITGMIMATLAPDQLLIIGISLSVVGFLAMVTGVGLFIYGQPGTSVPVAAGSSAKAASSSRLADRMEERFRRRQDEF